MRLFGWGKRYSIALFAACAIGLGTGGCGDNGSSSSNAAATVNRVESEPTQARLHPMRNSDVSGRVVCIEQSNGNPFVEFQLKGLRKATGLTQYMIWQIGSRRNMIFYKSYPVPRGGTLSASFEPTMEFLNWLKDGSKTQILITRVKDVDLFLLAREHWPSEWDPTEIGVPVAHGTFTGPLVGESAG